MNRLLQPIVGLTIAIAACIGIATGQNQPPSTDIFIVDLQNKDGRLTFNRPVNIINREGYDNQPHFLPDGDSLLFTSIREGALPDIYRYGLRDRSTARVTKTPEGEYSPTPMQGGKFFSVIRVEADQVQRLWKFPLDGGAPSLVLENIKPVGYHAWIDERRLALFVLGRPATLQLADVRTGTSETIESNIGRSLHKHPLRNSLTFVHKLSDAEWVIKELEIDTRKIRVVVRMLAGSEDFAWTGDGVIVSGKGSKLFKFDPRKDTEWQEAADFSAAGLKNITRLAISPRGDKVALVATH
jgi:hypothetical protein